MKKLLLILCWYLPYTLWPQASDSTGQGAVDRGERGGSGVGRTEVLSSGFLDVLSNGQINASARLLRIYVGEPGVFSVPVSLFSGVSANNFDSRLYPGLQGSNEHLVASYLNPLGGLLNLSVEGLLLKRRGYQVTRAGISYQSGLRLLTGYKSIAAPGYPAVMPVNFLNHFLAAGIYLQTGAWDQALPRRKGLLWLSLRIISTFTDPAQLRRFLPQIQSNGIYSGYSFGTGINIDSLVHVKLTYYRYIKPPEIDYEFPIYQLSFNYSLHKAAPSN